MLYINFLEQYNLKPWEVDALDADFVDVLLSKMSAQSQLAERDRRVNHAK